MGIFSKIFGSKPTASAVGDFFGKSPFGALVQHTKKVHECVGMIRPLMEALAKEDWAELHRLQDVVSKMEYEADQIKHSIRQQLPRKYFFSVDRDELENFLKCQDRIADNVEDFSIILMLRKTKLHPALKDDFFNFTDQILSVSNTLMEAAEELQNLAETSFEGAEAESVLRKTAGLGEQEWKADRLQRTLSQKIYSIEDQLDPVTIFFYEKMLRTLSRVANNAENTGDLLRIMIVKA